MQTVEILPQLDDLIKIAYQEFLSSYNEAVSRRGIFTSVLCGGETPKAFYKLIAARGKEIDWNKVHLFWGDERNVPFESQENNCRMAYDTLMSQVEISKNNIHRIETNLENPQKTARDYEVHLEKFFKLDHHMTLSPPFDFVLLGVGEDGHTASLFPDSQLKGGDQELTSWVIAPWVNHLKQFRISLTPRAFKASRKVILMVAGERKASIIQKIFSQPPEWVNGTQPQFPVQTLQLDEGEKIWLIDQAASSLLEHAG